MDPLIEKLKNRSDLAAKYFLDGVKGNQSSLVLRGGLVLMGKVGGWEEYDLLEKVFLAALDCKKAPIAENCLEKIIAKFPKSSRANRLEGLYFEFLQEWIKATDVYNTILENDPTNRQAARRLISICLAQERPEATIEAFNNYLTIHQGDTETWLEFAKFYLKLDQLRNAVFCLEEVLLANPKDFHALTRLGEVLFTIGGSENILLARRYFANAVEIHPESLRALFGLYRACCSLSSKEVSPAEFSVNKDLLKYSSAQISSHYSGSDYLFKNLVDSVLDA